MSDFESETGFTAPAPEELSPLFPEYEIQSLIATGGMGAVYRATQTSLAREVAIKILPQEFGSDPEFCASFEAEAKAMAKLNHPYLIGVYDFGEVAGMLFIVMEFVPGQSLHDACYGLMVDPAEAIRLVSAVAVGLAHAHEHGILHRDIKPANILLDERLQPKIGDFGLARASDRKVEEGESIFGTPGYTAPEVLAPPFHFDHRADIFSLGVLLHELLTGKLPEQDSRPTSSICRCDPRFDKVVRKATHANPNMRYQSATQIAEELEKISGTAGPRVLQQVADDPRAPVMAPRTLHPAKKDKTWLVVAVIAVVGAALFFKFRDQIIGQDDEAAPATVVPDMPPSGDPDETYVSDPAMMAGGAVRPKDIEPKPYNPVVDPATGTSGSEPRVVQNDPPNSDLTNSDLPSDPEQIVIENTVDPEPPIDPPTVVDGGLDESVEPPDSATSTEAKPDFDVDGFLERARSVMLERCSPVIEQKDELLKTNVNDFARAIKRGMRQNLSRGWWDAAESNLRDELDLIEKNGYILPDTLTTELRFKPWVKPLLAEYTQKQEAIDAVIADGLKQESKTYIKGLELRVPKLREANDPVAVKMIKEEIDRVLLNLNYFSELMMDAYNAK